MNKALALIAAERRRQISEEGYSAEHDDAHNDGVIAANAALLAMMSIEDPKLFMGGRIFDLWGLEARHHWASPLRKLTMAGALIVAEIERLMRADSEAGAPPDSCAAEPYPEHEKMLAVSERSQTIGEFMEYLLYTRGFFVGELSQDDFAKVQHSYVAHEDKIEKLLAEYFMLDQSKLEEEQLAMMRALEEQRREGGRGGVNA